MAEPLVSFLVALSFLAQAIIFWIIGESIIVASNNNLKHSWFLHFLKRTGIFFGFLISSVAMLGSLYYSEILNYPPCILCWYERIFIYPQVFMFAIAWIKKDNSVWIYSSILSIIGLFISSYHYFIQLRGASAFCDAISNGISCTEVFTMHFGYITIPLMTVLAFFLILMLSFVQRKNLLN
ncbi:MAG: disulfide bond formation protein B [Nanoarchaeota archaeon]